MSKRSMLLAALLVVSLAPQYSWPTLRQELAKYQLDASAFPDAEQPITSFKTLDTPGWFAIAYYWAQGALLPDTLRVRTYDKRVKRWRSAELAGPIGSILRLHHAGGRWYVGGHSSPSAGDTLVLTRDLRVVHTVKGWVALALPDGRVVYQHNMVHFAPAHPGSLGIYDPATNRETQLFPAQAVEPGGKGFFVDRWFSTLRLSRAPNTIAFSATEQDVRLTPSNSGEPVGPERTLNVTCTLDATPTCRATVTSRR